jgi:hypothetical protein
LVTAVAAAMLAECAGSSNTGSAAKPGIAAPTCMPCMPGNPGNGIPRVPGSAMPGNPDCPVCPDAGVSSTELDASQSSQVASGGCGGLKQPCCEGAARAQWGPCIGNLKCTPEHLNGNLTALVCE